MTPDQIAALFTRPDGTYAFARWGRPLVPVVFGVEDATLAVVKGALEAVVRLAGHSMTDTDPEQGANLMIFFVRDWDEVLAVPDLPRLVEGLDARVPRLRAEGATRYAQMRFDADGSIRAAFVFLRIDAAMARVPAEDLALLQAVQVILAWAEGAWRDQSPLALAQGVAVLRPEVAALIRAAYDRRLPPSSSDPSHALRVFARMG